jgi:putative transposase
MVWVSDTCIRLKNSFVYLAIILNVFTRSVRGWCLGHNLDQLLTLEALRMALENNAPFIIIVTRAYNICGSAQSS